MNISWIDHRTVRYVACCALTWLTVSAALAQNNDQPKDAVRGRFDGEIADFEKWDRQNAWPREPVLFVGSSSIRLWETAEAFPELPVINRGFGGSTIRDANHYFDRIVTKYQPRAIVFYSGDNDIAGGMKAQQVYDDFLAFMELVRGRVGKTPVYFISIKPSIARQKMWPEMKKANSLVQSLAGIDGQVIYVDVATHMLGTRLAGRQGIPSKKLFLADGLHLNADGYELWNKTLTPLLASADDPEQSPPGGDR